jgi:4-alpha-glucanotransferase
MTDPLFDWLDHRAAGVLLHPTSLPGPYQIGDFGASAHAFVDLIAGCGMRYWQMLPIGPTGFGDSPYQSCSSQAINPFLIDLECLVEKGWLSPEALKPLLESREGKVEFDRVRQFHQPIVDQAIEVALKDEAYRGNYEQFCREQASWLFDYALFMTLKAENQGACWSSWKPAHRQVESARKLELSPASKRHYDRLCFEQYLLFRQWERLKAYANSKGVSIIGDLPIYVAYDSVDVWSRPEVFQLNAKGAALKLAGVPPDYFNADGQFWGNPLYNWEYLESEGFQWWIDRLSHTLSLFDVVRFDHFRALCDYWSIPAKAASAKEGKWVDGPGIVFFEALKKALPGAKLILEDLGDITPGVIQLRRASGFPGIAVLQFAFGGGSDNFYLPHHIEPNCVIYTGTHDNDTSLGWYLSAGEATQDHLRRYLMVSGRDTTWDLIRTAYRSAAKLCVIPVQDLLDLGSEARMNVPGVASGNWSWRLTHEQMFRIGQNSAHYLKELAHLYGRTS